MPPCCAVPCSPRGDADRTHRATRPGLAAAPDELPLADQYGPVADAMGDARPYTRLYRRP